MGNVGEIFSERLGLDICLEWDTETTSTDINWKLMQDWPPSAGWHFFSIECFPKPSNKQNACWENRLKGYHL